MTVLFLCNSLIMGEEWEDYPESAYEKYLFQRFFLIICFNHVRQFCLIFILLIEHHD